MKKDGCKYSRNNGSLILIGEERMWVYSKEYTYILSFCYVISGKSNSSDSTKPLLLGNVHSYTVCGENIQYPFSVDIDNM